MSAAEEFGSRLRGPVHLEAECVSVDGRARFTEARQRTETFHPLPISANIEAQPSLRPVLMIRLTWSLFRFVRSMTFRQFQPLIFFRLCRV
jgi:hypothetical protein